MLDIFIRAFPFLISALIGASALYYLTNYLRPYQKKKEKASMVLAELANATRHFERSVENLESFLEKKPTRQLGRIVDYEKCKYSYTGFVGLTYSDLVGLPDKISRDLMQIGLVYRNTNLEVDSVIQIISDPSLSDGDLLKKFNAMIELIERMKAIVAMSKLVSGNVERYYRNVRAINANVEIDWPDDFYRAGSKET